MGGWWTRLLSLFISLSRGPCTVSPTGATASSFADGLSPNDYLQMVPAGASRPLRDSGVRACSLLLRDARKTRSASNYPRLNNDII